MSVLGSSPEDQQPFISLYTHALKTHRTQNPRKALPIQQEWHVLRLYCHLLFVCIYQRHPNEDSPHNLSVWQCDKQYKIQDMMGISRVKSSTRQRLPYRMLQKSTGGANVKTARLPVHTAFLNNCKGRERVKKNISKGSPTK